ncbi:MAG: hypothetical protein ACQESG_02375 [Nanobdellota archaeon]
MLFLASNCPSETAEDLTRYAQIAGIEPVNLKQTNEEVGAICRKPFFISVLSVKKDGN